MSGAEGKSDIDLFRTRSILFLPASNPRAIAKAKTSAADLVVFDLEDSVRPEDKDAARDGAVAAVAEAWPMPVAIRVNATGSEWHGHDLVAVTHCAADLVVVPRVDDKDELGFIRQQSGKPVAAMIETARGVLNAVEIASASGALIAGTNDLRADLRLPLDASRESVSASLQLILLAGRAAAIPVFDGVFNHLTDSSGFEAECRHGRSLGFDGKSLIHPDQIEPCNRLFGPSEDEVERARTLVDAFRGGAQRFDDRMIERMHVEAAERVLERARR